MRLRLIILLIAIGFSASSLAATVSISFPSLSGPLTYSTPGTDPILFDLGVQFSSITSASIAMSATGTAGSYYACNINTGSCTISTYGPVAEYFIPSEGYGTSIGAYGGLDLTTTSATLQSTDMLLDGEGALHFNLAGRGWIDIYNVTTLAEPTLIVSDVTLTVEGTVVPLPAALPLLLSGLTGLLFFQRKRKLA